MKYWGWGYVLRPPGAEPEEPGRSKGEVHIFNIYIIDSKRFQVDWLKTLGQVHYTRFCVRRTDGRTDAGRTDGWTDGHHLELRTFNYTKSRFDTHRYHFRWKQKMHARTGQNLYGPLTIVRRAIKKIKEQFNLNEIHWTRDGLSWRKIKTTRPYCICNIHYSFCQKKKYIDVWQRSHPYK